MALSWSVRALAFAAGVAAAAAETKDPDDWYPIDNRPPAGTSYPCVVTPLPRGLPGIPEGDRRYINHAYSLILRATQAKLVVLKSLEVGAPDLIAALARYQAATDNLAARLRDEPVPEGLEAFRDDVLAALTLQQSFFEKASAERRGGTPMADLYRIGEGREASRHLIAAWARMQQRYRSWPKETADSLYHHLCALDLF